MDLKPTKILMVRSSSYLENGVDFISHIIDFNMLQYISSSDSQVSSLL